MKSNVKFPGLGLDLYFNNSIKIGSFEITYYGLIIGFGLLLAMIYALKKFKKVGVDPDKALNAIIFGLIGGIIGARAYYVIFAFEEFKDNLWSIFNTRTGGLAIYGGIIGSLLFGVIAAKFSKVKILPLLDVVGIGFLIGQGIGRWGNFFNVEAFGSNTKMPWGMTSPSITSYLMDNKENFEKIGVFVDPNVPVHPCFLYESIWCIIGVFVLNAYLKHRKFDGEVFLMYCGYYGLGRFFIEGLRTDSLMIGTLRASQLLAGALVVASVLTIIIIRSKIKSNHDENYMKLFALTDEGKKIVLAQTTTKVSNKDKKIKGEITEEIAEEIKGEITNVSKTNNENESISEIETKEKGVDENDKS
ncbi:MAG: prolipoprotein diacylglyceryl transferase [Oscillospiraceae bacterium]